MKPLSQALFCVAVLAPFAAAAACLPAGIGPVEQATIVVPTQPPQPAPPSASSSVAPIAVAPATPTAPFRCESGKRFEVGQRSYCAYAEADSWDASEARCVANGGHLMTLDTQATSEPLHAALGSPLGAGRAAWIGLELKTKGGKDWKWITGEALTAASWNTGEPNNFDKNEQCAEWLVVDGRWNDTRCELKQPYLCQSKNDKPIACLRGGRSFSAGGVSYCLNSTLRTYAEAKRTCASDGGQLAVLKSAEENKSVRDAMAARFAAKRMWIGLTDAAEEGNWIWSSGASLELEAWQPGEPNDFNTENCAELWGDTWTWNDLDCSTSLPSVCESPPKRK